MIFETAQPAVCSSTVLVCADLCSVHVYVLIRTGVRLLDVIINSCSIQKIESIKK
jgi:hypothetical protein